MKKRLLALLLTLGLLTAAPALASEERQIQPISPWAYDAMSEVAALGMWDNEFYYCIQDEVTREQLDRICAIVDAKLALLGAPERTLSVEQGGETFTAGTTRGDVIWALYRVAAGYQLEGLDPDMGISRYMAGELGVVRGDGTDSAIDGRPCTLQETLVMAQRLVLALYDRAGVGSQGFLWKAQGNGNTLYLLGTIHVDRDNIYPFSKQLRDIIAGSDDAIFEVDFGDVEDATAFTAMQYYPEGESMADHVGAELYQRAVAAGAGLPAPYTMDETVVSQHKPWAFANLVNSVSLLIGETNLETPMAMDAYIYSKASNNGVAVDAVESYVYQGKLFDSLSREYQEGYLSEVLDSLEHTMSGNSGESAVENISRWVNWWKERDVGSFAADYDKDAVLANADELNQMLLVQRDPGMIAYADQYLKAEEPHSGILVVGAAHMIGETGIVQGLRELGYTVELVPAE